MTGSNTALPPLSASSQAAREAAQRIAKTQPNTQVASREKGPAQDGWRDTIESIVIAFIFAFLFRTFIAEAFIIPTGSMAETLYGRHKDVYCSQCQTRFRVGASDEVDRENGYFHPESRLKYGFCPNCRFQMNIEDELPFAGDRILVNKFPYEFHDPRRWDVVVFKFPEEPKTSYIKRLVGLPGETITVTSGDLFKQSGGLAKSEILRKSPAVQLETQILVYDHDKPAKTLLDHGFPERWGPVLPGQTEAPDAEGWEGDAQGRSFTLDSTGKADREYWLRYRHFLPQPTDWQNAFSGTRIELPPRPLLISDNYSYNSGYSVQSPIHAADVDSLGDRVNWVGDLTLSCTLDVLASEGQVTLELVEGRRKYHCDFDLASGRTTLSFQDEAYRGGPGDALEDVALGEAQTAVGKTGTYKLVFANVDDRLLLWIDGRLVKFQLKGEPVDGTYEYPQQFSERLPTDGDLAPVGIAIRKAHAKVSHLKIERDTFYTNRYDRAPHNPRAILESAEEYSNFARSVEKDRDEKDRFNLAEDEFLVLGDNSPRSADSRLWTSRPFHPFAVNRRLLIGKAFLIYWPHGEPFPNGRGYTPDFSFGGINGKSSLFWHKVLKYDKNGFPIYQNTDYASNAIPFLPQPMPWMSEEGRWFKWIR